jgi:hypothetical protein
MSTRADKINPPASTRGVSAGGHRKIRYTNLENQIKSQGGVDRLMKWSTFNTEKNENNK